MRKHLTHLFVYRLRNQADLEAWVEELSAVYDRKTIHQLYRIATDAPHSFLYINLMSRNKEELLYLNFSTHLVPRN